MAYLASISASTRIVRFRAPTKLLITLAESPRGIGMVLE
jgi:hypothetical protein